MPVESAASASSAAASGWPERKRAQANRSCPYASGRSRSASRSARHESRIDAPVIEREERQLTVVDAATRGSQLTDAVDRGVGSLRTGIVARERHQVSEQRQRLG